MMGYSVIGYGEQGNRIRGIWGTGNKVMGNGKYGNG